MIEKKFSKPRRLAVRIGIETLQSFASMANLGLKKEHIETPKNVEESLNNPYINRSGIPLAMDVFKPIGKEYEGKELPVIVSIHGGGLVMGDRKISLDFARDMASRGYLVFTIEYRLAPRATLCEQLDDICSGMDYIGRKIVDYDVDFTRIFLTADSAGAFLAIYTAAMKKSKKLQDAIGYKPSKMTFKAVGLSCGMFYTNQNDILGELLAGQFYGDKVDDKKFLQYMNPEHPEIIDNLPPTFLVTSRGDFLNNYTLMFQKALKKAGKTSRMLYYGEDDLTHTFNVSRPYLPQSKDANDKMLAFFEKQADIAREKQKFITNEKKFLKEIEEKIADGSLAKQPLYKIIKKMNCEIDDKLNAIAIVDDERKYNYRQLFLEWDKYAGVFSKIGMTEKNKSVVAILGAMTTSAVNAFYALNMTGATVSMCPYAMTKDVDQFVELLKNEKITDVILTDYQIDKTFLHKVSEQKKTLGLRNIIVLPSVVSGSCVTKDDEKIAKLNLKELKQVIGTEFMADLLQEYEASPAQIAKDDASRGRIILHKYNEDKNKYEAVAFSDEEINNYALSFAQHKAANHRFYGLSMDLSLSHSLAKQLHSALLMNDSILLSFMSGYNPSFFKAVDEYNVDSLVIYASMLDSWMKDPNAREMNFASLDNIFIENADMSEKDLEKYDEFIKSKGGSAKLYINHNKGKDYVDEINYKVESKENAFDDYRPMPVLPYFPMMQMPTVNKNKEFMDDQELKATTEESKETQYPRPPFMPIMPYFPMMHMPMMNNNSENTALGNPIFKARMSKLQQIAKENNNLMSNWSQEQERMNKNMERINKLLPKLIELVGKKMNNKQDDVKNDTLIEIMKIMAVLFDANTIDYYFEL